MIQEVKIATSRVGVLIGKGGATKKELEAKTHTTITIDSKEGQVKVEGSDENTILFCVLLRSSMRSTAGFPRNVRSK